MMNMGGNPGKMAIDQGAKALIEIGTRFDDFRENSLGCSGRLGGGGRLRHFA
jgi:hypothetical protein